MKEALKQIVDLLQPVAALADGTSFEHSEVIQMCVDATEIALDALAQEPRQRTWVGMTLEERVEVWIICGKPALKEWVDTVTAIEAKLKERNT